MTQQTEEKFKPMTFTVADPRTFEGDPYEVAERALKQAAATAAILEKMLDGADRMARNAEMERAFANQEEPKGSEWRSTPQGRQVKSVMEATAAIKKRLAALAVAAAYNPKKPPRS